MTGDFQLSLHAANPNSQRTVFSINMPPSFLLWRIARLFFIGKAMCNERTFVNKLNASLPHKCPETVALQFEADKKQYIYINDVIACQHLLVAMQNRTTELWLIHVILAYTTCMILGTLLGQLLRCE